MYLVCAGCSEQNTDGKPARKMPACRCGERRWLYPEEVHSIIPKTAVKRTAFVAPPDNLGSRFVRAGDFPNPELDDYQFEDLDDNDF